MDQVKGLSRSTHLILWGGALLFIFLFFDWQQVCVSFGGNSACGGQSGWHGWGVLVGILTIALIASEAVLVAGVDTPELPVKTAMITAGLAAGILLFTVLKFLVDNEARHWPAWIGLVLAILIAVGGWLRFSGDGVKEIKMSKPSSGGGSAAVPPPPPPPAEPPASAPPSPPAEPPAP